MKEIVPLIVVLILFIYGFWLMTRLDKFLGVNRNTIEREEEKEEPSCIMLTEVYTTEEMIKEIENFRSKHENMCVIMIQKHDKDEEIDRET